MSQCKRCSRLPNEFPGEVVKSVRELRRGLREISVDGMTWTTLYQCKKCGLLWEESYESTGHGEVPSVRKLPGAKPPPKPSVSPPTEIHPPSPKEKLMILSGRSRVLEMERAQIAAMRAPSPSKRELTPVDLLARRILNECLEEEASGPRRPQQAKAGARIWQERELREAIRFGDSRIDLNTTRFDADTDVEVRDVLALQGERPLVSVYVNGELLTNYRIDPCRKSDDYRGVFLHCSVRIVPGLGLMIDGLLSRDPKDESQSPSDLLRGVRFQPFKLEGAPIPNPELFGRGLFNRGLHFPGRVTPADIRFVCVCDQCHEPFTLEHHHTGFADQQYFYCETGIHTLLVNLGDLEGCPPPRAQNVDEQTLRAAEARLPACTECGKPFRYYNPLRCRSCGTPFIDFEKFPEIRPSEYYAQILAGTEPQHFEPNP